MQQLDEDRDKTLARIKHLLNSPDGELLVSELDMTWNLPTLLGDNPERTAYNVGLRDAFIFIQSLQTGDLISEDNQ